jgi:hypothetical protein
MVEIATHNGDEYIKTKADGIQPDNLLRKPECSQMSGKNPLDGRGRDEDGEIRRKRGDTLIGTVRKEHPGFASGFRADMKLPGAGRLRFALRSLTTVDHKQSSAGGPHTLRLPIDAKLLPGPVTARISVPTSVVTFPGARRVAR